MENITILPALALAVYLSLKTQMDDVIQTAETSIRILVALFSICSVIIVSQLLAIYFVVMGKTWATIALFSYPFVSAVCLYWWLRYYVTWKYKLVPFHDGYAQHNRLKAEIDKLSDLIGLRTPPLLFTSTSTYLPPFAFDMRGKTGLLYVPVNFYDEILKIANNDEILARRLRKYIFLHELAHFKHRDCLFLSWAIVYSQHIIWWLALSMVYIPTTAYFSNLVKILDSARTALFILALWGVPLAIFNIQTKSLLRYRENLADARASLYFSDEDYKFLLCKDDQKTPSILEKTLIGLAFALRGIKGSKPNALCLTSEAIERQVSAGRVSAMVDRIRNYLLNTHPFVKDRYENIRNRKFIRSPALAPSLETSIWIGLIYALAYFFLAMIYGSVDRTFKIKFSEMLLIFYGIGAVMLSYIYVLPILRMPSEELHKKLFLYARQLIPKFAISFLIGLIILIAWLGAFADRLILFDFLKSYSILFFIGFLSVIMMLSIASIKQQVKQMMSERKNKSN